VTSLVLVGLALALGAVAAGVVNAAIDALPARAPLLSHLARRDNWSSKRYGIVAIVTALAFSAVALRHGPHALTAVWMLFTGVAIAMSAIDFEHQIIPDVLSLGGTLVGWVVVPVVRALDTGAWLEALLDSLSGSVLGAGMFWSIGFLHARVSATLGRRFDHWPDEGEDYPKPTSLDYWVWFPGIGFGDVKLLAAIGAFLGPSGVLATVFAASLLGLIWGVAHALFLRSLTTPFGFGPHLAAGAFLVILSAGPEPFTLGTWLALLGLEIVPQP